MKDPVITDAGGKAPLVSYKLSNPEPVGGHAITQIPLAVEDKFTYTGRIHLARRENLMSTKFEMPFRAEYLGYGKWFISNTNPNYIPSSPFAEGSAHDVIVRVLTGWLNAHKPSGAAERDKDPVKKEHTPRTILPGVKLKERHEDVVAAAGIAPRFGTHATPSTNRSGQANGTRTPSRQPSVPPPPSSVARPAPPPPSPRAPQPAPSVPPIPPPPPRATSMAATVANMPIAPAKPPIASAEKLPAGARQARSQLLEIPVNRIRPNPRQPRKTFREGGMASMRRSIRKNQQTEPIEVIRVYDDPNFDYEIVKGERRWRGHVAEGIEFIEAIVRTKDEVPDQASQYTRCLIGDFHHEGYGKTEQILALLNESARGADLEELKALFGKDERWIKANLALAKLHPDLQTKLNPALPRNEQLSLTIAKMLASLPPEDQLSIVKATASIKAVTTRITEVRKLVFDKYPERKKKIAWSPADYARMIRTAIPRMAADATKTEGLDVSAFDNLVKFAANDVPEMLQKIDETVAHLTAMKRRIRERQQLVGKK